MSQKPKKGTQDAQGRATAKTGSKSSTRGSAGSAKVAPKSADKAQKAPKDKKKAAGESRISLPVRIVLIVFIVLMALSMVLPSLTLIVSGNNAQQQQEQQQDTSDDQSGDASGASADSTDGSSASDSVDSRYQALVDEQQAKLDQDPNNLAALLNAGNDYMAWGYALLSSTSTDADTSHAYDTFDQAISYYDRYLALNDSSAVRVNRALCQYYAGDTDDAIASLQELTTTDPTYGPAWANLGMLYQAKGDTDSAKNAYNQAIAVEPDDDYGSKSFAQQQLQSIASSESAPSGTSTGSSTSSTTTGLSDVLSNAAGTGL